MIMIVFLFPGTVGVWVYSGVFICKQQWLTQACHARKEACHRCCQVTDLYTYFHGNIIIFNSVRMDLIYIMEMSYEGWNEAHGSSSLLYHLLSGSAVALPM